MKRLCQKSAVLAAAIGMALGSWSSASRAAAFQLFEQNASGLGNAYAGQAASAEDAGAVFFNPAGITRLPGVNALGSVNLVKPKIEFAGGASCAPYLGVGAGTSACPLGAGGNLGHGAGGSGGDAGSVATIPAAYFTWEVAPGRAWAGFGINAPFGLATEWDNGWAGRFHAIKSEVQALNVNPTIAWKISPMVSVGAGLDAQRLTAELSNAVSYRAAALASGNAGLIGATPVGAEGVATVKGDDWAWGWNAGVTIDITPATRIGVSYRSKTSYKLEGDVTFADRPAALGVVPQLADGNVTAEIELPAVASLALAQNVGSAVQLLADWTWTGWNSIQDLTVVRASGPLSGQTLSNTPLRFKNSWRAGLGANFQVSAAWKVRAGLAYDRTPVQDEFRTPRLPDGDRTWIAVGAQWAFAPKGAMDVGYAYIMVKDGSSNLANQETATSAPRGSLVGTYNSNVQVLGVQVRWMF